MKINVASQTIGAEMITASDGSAFTGAVTVYVTGDGGTQAIGSVGSGACTHEGNGFHTYVPAQAETNYAHVAFTFIGTGAVPATVQVYTNFPQTVDNATNISAIKTKTDFLPSVTAGASGGVFIAGTNAATTITTGLTTTFTGNLTGSVASVTGAVGSVTGAVGSVTGNVGGIAGTIQTLDALDTAQDTQHAATQTAVTSAFTEIKGATWSAATDTLEALRDRGDAAWVTATGFSTHTAADVWAAATRTLTANTNLNDITVADVLTTQMTEAYAADGAAPTLAQALMLIQQMLGDFTISGTTMTVKKVDGTTTAATFTLNDGTSPTGVTRAT